MKEIIRQDQADALLGDWEEFLKFRREKDMPKMAHVKLVELSNVTLESGAIIMEVSSFIGKT